MPAHDLQFSCVIEDHVLLERFSAEVIVRKKIPVRTSLQDGKIDLADIFIEPVSGQSTARVHHHFVLYDSTGHGLYIVRDPQGRETHRRPCTTWDLGQHFGARVMEILKDLA